MHHTLPMRISAVLYAFFGVSLVFAPNALLAMYQAPELNAMGIYNSMLLGATYLAFAVMTWAASRLPYPEARVVILGGLVANGAGFLVALYRQLTSSEVVAAGWINVVLMLVFALVYGWLYLQHEPATRPAQRIA